MSALKEHRLEEFPQDNIHYLLKWIGKVVKSCDATDFLINVTLTPLNHFDDLNEILPDSNKMLNKNGTIFRQVDVGLLCYLVLGSIWLNGVCILLPKDYPNKDNKTIKVKIPNPSEGIIEPIINVKPDYKHFFIEKENFFSPTLRFRNDQITCDSNVGIIFPCHTIAKLFYFHSVYLTKLIFYGLKLNDIYVSKVSTPIEEALKTRIAYLTVEDHIPLQLAHTIARIIYSKEAHQSVVKISSDLKKDNINSTLAFIKTRFPFTSECDLKIEGKFINSKDGWKFLVYNIKTCICAFPLDELYIAPKRDPESLPEKEGEKREERTVTREKSAIGAEIRINSSKESAWNKNLLHEPIDVNSSFPGLPSVEKIQKTDQKYKVLSKSFISIQENFTTDFDTSNDSSVAPIDTFNSISKKKEELTNLFDYLNQTIEALEKTGVRINFLPIFPENNNPGSILSLLPFKRLAANDQKWCFIKKIRKNKWEIPRKVAVIELIFLNRYFYLFEIQRRENESFKSLLISDLKMTQIEKAKLEVMLIICAKSKGRWVPHIDNYLDSYNYKLIKHYFKFSPEENAKKYLSQIQGLIKII